jgi:streptomycin 6-kinase
MLSDFEPWIARWALEPDGEPFVTPYAASRLLPVRQAGAPAMLKLAASDDERRGAAVMDWWGGDGAAPVLARAGDALLLVRAEGARTLDREEDGAAIATLCAAVGALHSRRSSTPPPTPPLARLFAVLLEAAEPRLEGARRVARALLDDPQEAVLLHGDIHHFNVLDFGAAGWLAIDPWGFQGERAYDYANILRNPDLARVMDAGRFDRGRAQIAAVADLQPDRLLLWIYAYAGLAAAWELADSHDPSRSWAVLALAEARL